MKHKILVVDDEVGMRDVIKDLLTDEGYEVVEAEDGKDALDKILASEEPFHLLVTDLDMPRLNGRQLMERLGGSIPTIVTSGTFGDGSNPSEREFLEQPGVVGALLKGSFEIEDLLNLVAKILRQPQLTQS